MKRINKNWLYPFLPLAVFIMGVIFMLPSSCKKERNLLNLPAVTTGPVCNITESTASCSGEVPYDGDASVTERGVCWSTGETPTIADERTMDGQGTGSFTSNISGLSPNTLYRVSAYARNVVGTAYGSYWFIHTASGTIKDIDSNLYHTVTIGTQEWTCENLKTTRLNNGEKIQWLLDLPAWQGSTGPGYGSYGNSPSFYESYGSLYNGYAVSTGKLCPAGWHVPGNDEWHVLVVYLGDTLVAGGKMKEAGTLHWEDPNGGATNESGFSALPGGNLISVGDDCNGAGFSGVRSGGYWWSQTHDSAGLYFLGLSNYGPAVYRLGIGRNTDGLSVRCIRN